MLFDTAGKLTPTGLQPLLLVYGFLHSEAFIALKSVVHCVFACFKNAMKYRL